MTVLLVICTKNGRNRLENPVRAFFSHQRGQLKGKRRTILKTRKQNKNDSVAGCVTVACADDVPIVTGNRRDLQEAMTRWNDTLNRRGMRMNKHKAERNHESGKNQRGM